MVQAYLREKKGLYYIVIYYYDNNHERKQIWISTKLKMRGNKRKAEEMLLEYQQYYDVEKRELVYGQSETKVIEIQRPAYIENINEIVKEK